MFESSAELIHDYGSAVFVRRFMRSNVARRLDEGGMVSNGALPKSAVMEVHAEYDGRPYGKEIYHTLDPAQYVDRILEVRNVAYGEDPIARGVKALRRIRSRA